MAQNQDEGFHEIQLNGKQLVFLFMAATVVSVVIFLCGVLVGRGVRAERAAAADTAASNAVAEVTTPQQQPIAPPAPAPGSDPTAAPAPAPPSEELSYFNRLEKPGQKGKSSAENRAAENRAAENRAAENRPAGTTDTKTAENKAAEKSTARPAPAPPPPPPTPAPVEKPVQTAAPAPAVADAGAEPPGQGFAVQIAALNVRSDADAIVKRLTSKGYAAYVLMPAAGTPSVFRVRVGKFSTRREAETVAARLQKEEQFKPWVTR